MNELETQLRSWKPRRPSAKLEALFAPAAPQTSRPRALPWVVPAMACFLFTCLMISHNGPASLSESGTRSPLMGVILSNQSYVAYLPNSYQPANNRVDTFEWTNGSRSTPSMPFRSPQRADD